MSATTKNPVSGDFVSSLKQISQTISEAFKTMPMEDPGGLKDDFDSRVDEGEKFPSVSFFPGYGGMSGRLWAGYRNRTVAYARLPECWQLARFMDMLTFLLWDYRRRSKRPIEDKDLIFSLMQTQADVNDYPWHVAKIREIESLFLEHKIFRSLNPEDQRPDEDNRTVRFAVKQLGIEMRMIQEETDTKLGGVAKRLADLTAKVSKLDALEDLPQRLLAVEAIQKRVLPMLDELVRLARYQSDKIATLTDNVAKLTASRAAMLDEVNAKAPVPCHKCGCLVKSEQSHRLVDPKDLNSAWHTYCLDCYDAVVGQAKLF
jgi:hypothetical protein